MSHQDDRYQQALEATRQQTEQGLDPRRLDAVLRRIQASQEGTRPARSWRGLLWLGGGLAAAAAALLVILALPDPSPPSTSGAPVASAPGTPTANPASPVHVARLMMKQGDASIKPASGSSARGFDPTRIDRRAEVALAAGARLDLALSTRVRAVLLGPARFEVGGDRPPHLLLGQAAFAVDPRRPSEASFVVRAGDREVVVHGTRFFLRVEQEQLKACQVTRGEVRLRSVSAGQRSGPSALTGGQSFGVASLEVPSESELFERPWWRSVEDLAGEPRGGYLSVSSTPTGSIVTVAGQAVGEAPLQVYWASGRYTVVVTREGYQPAQQVVMILDGQRHHLRLELSPNEEPSARPVVAAGSRSKPRRAPRAGMKRAWSRAGGLLRARRCADLSRQLMGMKPRLASADQRARAAMLDAECALRRGEKKRALHRFEAIARSWSTTSSGKAALFEAAKLLADLGRPGPALAAFSRFTRQHPGDPLAAAAGFRRCELLIVLKQDDKARACLQHFRKKYPGQRRARQSLLLLATLAHKRASWAEAARLYQAYLKQGVDLLSREKVLYRRVICLQRGRLPGLREAISDYLKSYPGGRHADELRKISQ